MQYDQIQGTLGKIISALKEIAHNTRQTACCTSTPVSGSGDVPAGLSSVTIIQTGTGTVAIVPTGGTEYDLTTIGESYTLSGGTLPAFTVSSSDGATWKWYGIS